MLYADINLYYIRAQPNFDWKEMFLLHDKNPSELADFAMVYGRLNFTQKRQYPNNSIKNTAENNRNLIIIADFDYTNFGQTDFSTLYDEFSEEFFFRRAKKRCLSRPTRP